MANNADRIFSSSSEKQVTRAIVREFARQLDDCVESDVLIAGSGPSGLMCGKILAENGVRAVIVERNNYLGGGFWIGGYLMNTVVVRSPADALMRQLGIPMKEPEPGLFTADGPHACSKLIAAACDSGVKVLNMTSVDDVVFREDHRIAGLVINWTPVQTLPRQISCVDPVALESKLVVDATGHDASVFQHLVSRGLATLPGCGPMWIEQSEDDVVNRTGFVHPGLIATGMSVSSVYGLARMGPSFGSMLLSGVRAAHLVLGHLGKPVPEAELTAA